MQSSLRIHGQLVPGPPGTSDSGCPSPFYTVTQNEGPRYLRLLRPLNPGRGTCCPEDQRYSVTGYRLLQIGAWTWRKDISAGRLWLKVMFSRFSQQFPLWVFFPPEGRRHSLLFSIFAVVQCLEGNLTAQRQSGAETALFPLLCPFLSCNTLFLSGRIVWRPSGTLSDA